MGKKALRELEGELIYIQGALRPPEKALMGYIYPPDLRRLFGSFRQLVPISRRLLNTTDAPLSLLALKN